MSGMKDFLAVEEVPVDVEIPAPEPEAEARVEAPEPEPAPEPRAEPEAEVPDDIRGLRAAAASLRKERADYKGERDRLAGELAAIKAQMEAAKQAPVPQAAPEAPQIPTRVPNPIEDPQGYHDYQEQLRFNDRLNVSEVMLREKHDDVDEKMEVFKKAATANPALRSQLAQQAHPYKWAYEQAQRIMAMDEIGTDPNAYRSKIEAEIRAKIEAEMAGTVAHQPAAARVVLPQSLGTARSAAPRTAPVAEAPEFADIFKRPKRG